MNQSTITVNLQSRRRMLQVKANELKIEKYQNSFDEERQLVARIESTILTERPNVKFSDVCGLDEAIEVLETSVIMPAKFPELFESISPLSSILLFGSTGTGKTFIAQATAGEATSTTIFSISPSDLFSKYEGESLQRVKTLFKVARMRSPSVIILEDFDAYAVPKSICGMELMRHMKELMSEKNTGVFVLATTRTPQDLDGTVLRCFQGLIHCPLASFDDRKDLFSRLLLNDKTVDISHEDLTQLCRKTEGLSCGIISLICNHAKHRAMERLLDSTHFVIKIRNGKVYSEPCDEYTSGAIKTSLRMLSTRKFPFSPITTRDDVFYCVSYLLPRFFNSSEARSSEIFAERYCGSRVPNPPVSRPSKGSEVLNFILSCIS